MAVVAVALLGAAAPAPAAPGVKLTVALAGIRSDKGSVICELFANAAGYPKDPAKALQLKTVGIKERAASCDFEGLAPGTYAVAAYHDENGNGKLDKNFLGIPSEGVAASNDARGTMGPPSFEKAKFVVAATNLTLTIHLSY